MGSRKPKELIDLYWFEVWGKGDTGLIYEICGDPMIRHYPGKVVRMDIEEQIKRVKARIEQLKPRFTHEVLVCDDTYATSIWNMYTDGRYKDVCGIETFKCEDGRLTECWNLYGDALWDGEMQDGRWDGMI